MPQVVKDVVDTVMLPGRVAKGEVDPTMDDIITAAGIVTPGVSPVRSAKVLTEAGKAVPKPVARAIRSDGMVPEQVAGKLSDIGPNAVLADLGPNLRAQAAAVATVPGAGQKTVVDAMTKRKLEAPGRLRTELDDTLGVAPIPGEVKAGLKEQQKRLSPEYEAVLDAAGTVDTKPVAAALDDLAGTLRGDAQAEVRKVRALLNRTPTPVNDPAAAIQAAPPAQQAELLRRHLAGEPLSVDSVLDDRARVLFEVRKAIDGIVGSTSDSNVQRVLGNAHNGVRKQVDDLLAAAVPGIKEIDAKHSGLKREGDAFDRGQTVLDSGRESPRPAELQAQVDKSNAPHGVEFGPSNEAARLTQGARAEIDRIVGTNLNDRAALNSLLKGEGDWNYERLSTLFGKEKTDRIYKVLESERAMAETENLALAGSKTAAVQAAQKDVTQSTAAPGVLQSAADLKFGSAAQRLKDRILGGVAERRQTRRNDSLADTIMSNEPLKSGTTGKTAMDVEMLGAIMRSEAGDPEARKKAARSGVKAYQDRVH
jgi:hypothetical protein